MGKWKCEICNSEFDNFHAQGFNHKIYCPLCYFKELNKRKDKEIARLNKIIDELEKGLIYTLEYIIDIDKITIKEYNAIYKKATNIDYDFHISFEENIRRLQELKEEGNKNE